MNVDEGMLERLRALECPTIPPIPEDGKPRPFWSVAVPVFNRRTFLAQCLASVLDQYRGPEHMEILVVDSGTRPVEDEVAKVGRGIVQYHRLSEDRGAADSWNWCVRLSRGLWIHLLHDDDYVLSGFYDTLENDFAEAGDGVGAAFTGYENEDQNGNINFRKQVYGNQRGIHGDWPQVIGAANVLNPPAVVIRRSTYEMIGGYHPRLRGYGEEWEFYKRAACFVDWWYEPKYLARYRLHGESGTLRLDPYTKYRRLLETIEMSERIYPESIRNETGHKARATYFEHGINEAVNLAVTANEDAAVEVLRAILVLAHSQAIVDRLFEALRAREFTGVRRRIISILADRANPTNGALLGPLEKNIIAEHQQLIQLLGLGGTFSVSRLADGRINVSRAN
jgi:glycosyltransferase involved in cell wall biosynthesis